LTCFGVEECKINIFKGASIEMMGIAKSLEILSLKFEVTMNLERQKVL